MNAKNLIGNIARIACVLELTTEKPGNITPNHDFTDTKFENFIYGSIFIGNHVENAFMDGKKGEFKIGKRIFQFVNELKFYNKRNTHFGIALLFIPVATACGIQENQKNFNNLRDAIDYVMKNTTVDDAIYFHKSVKIGNVRVGCAGKNKIDILSENFEKSVRKENINLYHLMKISENDLIARELTTKMEISFSHCLDEISREEILSLYMLLLSKFPDSLIEKKYGRKEALKVSEMAKNVVNKKMDIKELRNYLYRKNLNPGSIADITANIIFLCLLKRHFKFFENLF